MTENTVNFIDVHSKILSLMSNEKFVYKIKMSNLTVKHRTLDQIDQIRTGNVVIFLNLKWFSNKLKLARNLIGRNKFVWKKLVSGFILSERTNSWMVKQYELWTDLSISIICNLLIIAMTNLDETYRECLPDIPSGIGESAYQTFSLVSRSQYRT